MCGRFDTSGLTWADTRTSHKAIATADSENNNLAALEAAMRRIPATIWRTTKRADRTE